ncbi:hypothetical protein PtA15_3A764 [Puccinia triticina]|uniref:Ribosomal protein S12 n=1 Tax=Puccinia triticina TaxID=208348 RepID=A0ABY7CFC2_9BASI|nr:uncharacterized protein PtA15_3A764 [Puccinia triticina]WAQ83394.1 hypothetical protein PtA15_3A764 [Puccinia triticina]WAR54236.1 hypothetical protein PtB15_3B750 [Puccinia triticina]
MMSLLRCWNCSGRTAPSGLSIQARLSNIGQSIGSRSHLIGKALDGGPLHFDRQFSQTRRIESTINQTIRGCRKTVRREIKAPALEGCPQKKGGRTQDLIGLKYKIIRGALDFAGVVGRRTSRSKYGVKKPKDQAAP